MPAVFQSCSLPPTARTPSDDELVAIVLADRPGCKKARKAARELLSNIGGLAGLARFSSAAGCLEPLQGYPGTRLLAAVELGLRCSQPQPQTPTMIRNSEDIVRAIGARIRHLMHEEVWMIGLDSFSAVSFRCRIAKGQAMGCTLLTRDVLRTALQLRAEMFVLVHNHPSNDPRPSEQDIRITSGLLEASLYIGIPLLDHVIVTQTEHRSLLEMGLLPDIIANDNRLHVAEAKETNAAFDNNDYEPL